MAKLIFFGLLLFTIINPGYGATCTSSRSGDWGNTATWTGGNVPAAGDMIEIKDGHIVTVSTTFIITGPAVTLSIKGTLKFTTGKKMTIPSGSVIEIAGTGSVTKGTGGGSSNVITIGTVDVWRAADGDLTGPIRLTESCLASIGCVLPITLLDFNVQVENRTATVSWTTSAEANVSHFSVEASPDLKTWSEISDIEDQGGEVNVYSCTDPNTLYDIRYYRLKEVDIFGTIHYYEPKAAKPDTDLGIAVYPIPSSGFFTVSVPDEGEVKLLSTSGQIVMAENLSSGSTTFQTDKIKPGFYLLLIISGRYTERIPFKIN